MQTETDLQTCSVLQHIHEASSTLQYAATLQMSAHLDVQDGTLPGLTPDSSVSTEDAATNGTEQNTLPLEGAESSSSQVVATIKKTPLSASEKTELLKERERRWSVFDPVREEEVRVKGHAGVYELQEGIFLMCNDYHDEGRVSVICASA